MRNFALENKPYDMNKTTIATTLAASALLAVSCAPERYCVAGVQRSRIVIDSRYDATPDREAESFLAPYRAAVDSLMSPVMGTAACDMGRQRPESPLSNLLSDILVWSSQRFGEQPDFAVYNMGGIRATISKGDVTRGDILDIAPFDNKICFLTLKGSDVLELFRQIAQVGGEGVSGSVRLVITKDGRLLSSSVGGKQIDPAASYRVTTIDYLAQGNDHLEAFKKKTEFVSPKSDENNARFLIEDYFKAMKAEGKSVDAKVEGRIVIEK